MDPEYVHLPPECALPDLTGQVFRAVVIVEVAVSAEWRERVSAWLVNNGCRYMLAWGRDCKLWDDSVDHASLSVFGYGDIPDAMFVMTTWHEKEPLKDVFWFSEYAATHPAVALNRIILVHVSPLEQKSKLLGDYQAVNRAS